MVRNGILFAALFAFVLLVNASLISFDFMYAEQPMLFAANKSIHTWGDLAKLYLHPQMFNVFSIPFFRPSGHFLTYQLITPLLGWHNTKGFIVVNLLFLALTGLLLIKLYQHLFPGLKVGGYLAFSIYLMHPALILSRLIVLHFEFAYVFFTLLSLYYFMLFCSGLSLHSEEFGQQTSRREGRQVDLFLLFSMGFYFIAVTFKEPALMLGPVLAIYLCFSCYKGGPMGAYIYKMINNRKNLKIIALILTLSLVFALYLSLAWPTMTHPLASVITGREKIAALKELIKIILGLSSVGMTHGALYQPTLIWRELLFTTSTKIIIWSLLLLIVTAILLFCREKKKIFNYKKSFLFLVVSAILFMIIPINWAMALPWHLSLTLIFLSLMAGFGYEYLMSAWIQNKRLVFNLGIVLSVITGLMTIKVNDINLQHILSRNSFALFLNHNAIHHPPQTKMKLNADTVLVVADSVLHDSYALGNSTYPLFLRKDINVDALQKAQAFSFIKLQPIYNGNLFKWAYLRPDLQEEIYPFEVNKMHSVPDAMIYHWLQHYSNIVCLGYNHAAQWQDKTEDFKKNLLTEKARRFIAVHQYELLAATKLNGSVIYTKKLFLPEYALCQYECDQNVRCEGFSYQHRDYHYHSLSECQYYDALPIRSQKFCATCIGFVKMKL